MNNTNIYKTQAGCQMNYHIDATSGSFESGMRGPGVVLTATVQIPTDVFNGLLRGVVASSSVFQDTLEQLTIRKYSVCNLHLLLEYEHMTWAFALHCRSASKRSPGKRPSASWSSLDSEVALSSKHLDCGVSRNMSK